jgi:hypothetical protein
LLLIQSQIPQLNDDPGAIIAFPDETFGLSGKVRLAAPHLLAIEVKGAASRTLRASIRSARG